MSDQEAAARESLMFQGLVAMLAENAMMALGKLVPPGAEEPIVQLPLAQAMIDMLDVLKKRTEGNLTPEETRELGNHLTNLRLNFLEVQKELEGARGEGGDEPADAAEAAEA